MRLSGGGSLSLTSESTTKGVKLETHLRQGSSRVKLNIWNVLEAVDASPFLPWRGCVSSSSQRHVMSDDDVNQSPDSVHFQTSNPFDGTRPGGGRTVPMSPVALTRWMKDMDTHRATDTGY
ncbi:Hypothetical protein SMAX5B_019349 [Scophthalmus maximus]|uniref:Uncharacterized protein n=1 Tax=Scophthalmus maximus TaxID=52904 RepID=A0A2U9BVH5_SCOMX|nr:Hypothetical protein SMAX5B_019349 [Scophthalmus maximus]